MPPKKKDGGGAKKAAKKDQDAGESTLAVFRKYKKNCERLSAPISQKLVEKLQECVTEGGDLTEVTQFYKIGSSVGRIKMERNPCSNGSIRRGTIPACEIFETLENRSRG